MQYFSMSYLVKFMYMQCLIYTYIFSMYVVRLSTVSLAGKLVLLVNISQRTLFWNSKGFWFKNIFKNSECSKFQNSIDYFMHVPLMEYICNRNCLSFWNEILHLSLPVNIVNEVSFSALPLWTKWMHSLIHSFVNI